MSEWDKFKETKLRNLWAGNTPLKDIAAELGFSETATRSKIRRMGLPPRDSSQKKGDAIKQLENLDKNECKWPLGDPKKPGFGFCAKPVVRERKPYCLEHTELGTEKKVG